MAFQEILDKRRSVNFFDTQKEIPDERIKELIEMAAKTPSSFNLQPWSVILLRDPDEKAKLRELAWDQPKVTEAPLVMIMLADRNAWQKGHPFLERNFKEMVTAGMMEEGQHQWFTDACKGLYGDSAEKQQAFAVKNTAFFAMTLMYAAKSLGLDTHPMDGFDHEAVKKAFNIPKEHWIPLLLAVGYFREGETLFPPKWRKTYDEIVVKYH